MHNSDATYLIWIDISAIGMDSDAFADYLRKTTGLYLSAGEEYGECGKHFMRMNLATQRERVFDGLSRLEAAVKAFKKQ